MSSAEERREARRRRRAGGEDTEAAEAPAEEETSSRRSRRHRGGDDETPAEEVTSTRSRRRRGGDDEDAKPKEEPKQEEPAATDDSADTAAQEAAAAAAAEQAEERRRRQREEEEEERRREEEKERKQQEAEQKRREEEERARKEEEERKRKDVDEDWDELWQNDVHENTNEQTDNENNYYFKTKRKKIETSEASVAFYNSSDNDSRFVSLMSQGFSSESLYSNDEKVHEQDSDLNNKLTDCDDKMEMENKSNNSENNEAEWEILGGNFDDDKTSRQSDDDDEEEDEDETEDEDDEEEYTGFDNNKSGTLSSWKSEACLFSPDFDSSQIGSHIENTEADNRCDGLPEHFNDEYPQSDRYNGIVHEHNLYSNNSDFEKKRSSFSVRIDNDELLHKNTADTANEPAKDTASECGHPTSNTDCQDENDYSVKYGIYLDVEIDYSSSFPDCPSVPEVTPIWIENPGETENTRAASTAHKDQGECNRDGDGNKDMDYVDPPDQFSSLDTEEAECKLLCDCYNDILWKDSSDVMGSSACIDHFETIEESTEDVESNYDSSYCYNEEVSVDTKESSEDDILMEVISKKSEQREGSQTSLESILGSEILSTSSKTDMYEEDEIFEEVISENDSEKNFNAYSSNIEEKQLDIFNTKCNEMNYTQRHQTENNDSGCVMNEPSVSDSGAKHSDDSRKRDVKMTVNHRMIESSQCHDKVSYPTDCVQNECKYEPNTYEEWRNLKQSQNTPDVNGTKEKELKSAHLNRKRNLDIQTEINSYVLNRSGDAKQYSDVHLQLENNGYLKDELQSDSGSDSAYNSVHKHKTVYGHIQEGNIIGISNLKPDTVVVLGTRTRQKGFTMDAIEMQQPVESSVFESPRNRTSVSSLNYPSSVQTLNEVTHSILNSKTDTEVPSSGFLNHRSSSEKELDMTDSLNHPNRNSEAQMVLKSSASAFLGKLVDSLPTKPKRVNNPNALIGMTNVPFRSPIRELNSKLFSDMSNPIMKMGSSDFPGLKDKETSKYVCANFTPNTFQNDEYVSTEISHYQTDMNPSRNQTTSDVLGEVKEIKQSIKMLGRKVLPPFDELEKSKLWEKQALKNHQDELEFPKDDFLNQKEESMLFVKQKFDETDSVSSDIPKPSHLPLWLRIHRNSLPASGVNNHVFASFTDSSPKMPHSVMPKMSLYLKQKNNLDSTDNSVISSEDFSPNSSFVSESGSSVFTEDSASRVSGQRLHHPFLKTQSTPALYKHVSHYGSNYSLNKLQHASSLHSIQVLNRTAKPWRSTSSETSVAARRLSLNTDKLETNEQKTLPSPRLTFSKTCSRRVSVPELNLRHGHCASPSSPLSPTSSVMDRRLGGLGISGRRASSIDGLSQQYPSMTKIHGSSPRWLKTQSLILQSHKDTEKVNGTDSVDFSTPGHQNCVTDSARFSSKPKQDPSSSLTHVKKEKLWREQRQTELVGVIRARQNANLLIGTYPLSEQVEQLGKSLECAGKQSVSPRDKPKRRSSRHVMTVREKYCLDENDSDEMASEDINIYGSNQQVYNSKMNEDLADIPVVPAAPIVGNSSLLQRIENVKSLSGRFIANCRDHLTKSSKLNDRTVKDGNLESMMISGNVHLTSGLELEKKLQENTDYQDLREKRKNRTLCNIEATRQHHDEITPKFETFKNLNIDVATSEKSRESSRNLENQESIITSVARQFESLTGNNEKELELANEVNDNNFSKNKTDSAKPLRDKSRPKNSKDETDSTKPLRDNARTKNSKDEADSAKPFRDNARPKNSKDETDSAKPFRDNARPKNSKDEADSAKPFRDNVRPKNSKDETDSAKPLKDNARPKNSKDETDSAKPFRDNIRPKNSKFEIDSAKPFRDNERSKNSKDEQQSLNTVKGIENIKQILTDNYVYGGNSSNCKTDKIKMDVHTGDSCEITHDNKTQFLQTSQLMKTPDSQIQHNIVKVKKGDSLPNENNRKRSSLSCVRSLPDLQNIIPVEESAGPIETSLPAAADTSQSKYTALLHRFETLSKEVTETAEQCALKNNHVRRSQSGSRVSDFKSKFLNVTAKDNMATKTKLLALNLTERVDLAMCQKKVANHPALQINVTYDEKGVAHVSPKTNISRQTLPCSSSCPKFNTETNSISSLTNSDSNVSLLKSKFLTTPMLVNSLTHSNSCPKLNNSPLSDKTHFQFKDTESEKSPKNDLVNSDHISLLEKFEKLTQDLMESEASRLEDVKTERRTRIRRLSSGLDITELQKKFSEENQTSRGSSPNPFVIDSIRRNCSLHSSWQQLSEPSAKEDVVGDHVSTHRHDQSVASSSVFVSKIASKFRQKTHHESDSLASKTNMPAIRSPSSLSKPFCNDSRITNPGGYLHYSNQQISDVSHEGNTKSEVLNKVERLVPSKGSYITNIIGKFKQSSSESSKLNCGENLQSHCQASAGSYQEGGEASSSGRAQKTEKISRSPGLHVTNIAGRFKTDTESSETGKKQYQNQIACSKVNTTSLQNSKHKESFAKDHLLRNDTDIEDTKERMEYFDSQTETDRIRNNAEIFEEIYLDSVSKTASSKSKVIHATGCYNPERRKTFAGLSKSISDRLPLESPVSLLPKRNEILNSSSVNKSEIKSNVKSRTNVSKDQPSSATVTQNSALCFESLLNMNSLALNVTEEDMAQGLVWSTQTSPDLRKSEVDFAPSSAFSWNINDEEEARMEEERLDRERQEQEEEERRKKEEEQLKKKGKRKGLGGLSPEKKKLLKKLIMQKAAEDLRNEAKKKAEEKEQFINAQVPELNTAGMNQADLQQLCKRLHDKICVLEEEVFDWEVKIRKQDFEINNLQLKFNDAKGKFIKPVLRKVNKTESKLAKLDKKESRDFRSNLKSTGQNKFALDDKEESKKPEWREQLKKEGEGEAEAEES